MGYRYLIIDGGIFVLILDGVKGIVESTYVPFTCQFETALPKKRRRLILFCHPVSSSKDSDPAFILETA